MEISCDGVAGKLNHRFKKHWPLNLKTPKYRREPLHGVLIAATSREMCHWCTNVTQTTPYATGFWNVEVRKWGQRRKGSERNGKSFTIIVQNNNKTTAFAGEGDVKQYVLIVGIPNTWMIECRKSNKDSRESLQDHSGWIKFLSSVREILTNCNCSSRFYLLHVVIHLQVAYSVMCFTKCKDFAKTNQQTL